MGRLLDLLPPATNEKPVEDQRGSKRRRFPFAAEMLDRARVEFGGGVRVRYARQGDDETGEQLAGVPFSRVDLDPAVMPTAGCGCSACHPTQAAMKYRQKAPGAAFGLDRRGRFKQLTTYRRDLEQPWEQFVAVMRRGRSQVDDEDQ